MRILSADLMAKIPRAAIKHLVKSYFDASITENGADAMAGILEKKAEEIAKFAVENAKKEKRVKVTKEDISKYVMGRD
jgi:histone H3/H4